MAIDTFYVDKVYIYNTPLSNTDLYTTTYYPLEDSTKWNAVLEFDTSYIVRQSLFPNTLIQYSTKGTVLSYSYCILLSFFHQNILYFIIFDCISCGR